MSATRAIFMAKKDKEIMEEPKLGIENIIGSVKTVHSFFFFFFFKNYMFISLDYFMLGPI